MYPSIPQRFLRLHNEPRSFWRQLYSRCCVTVPSTRPIITSLTDVKPVEVEAGSRVLSATRHDAAVILGAELARVLEPEIFRKWELEYGAVVGTLLVCQLSYVR